MKKIDTVKIIIPRLILLILPVLILISAPILITHKANRIPQTAIKPDYVKSTFCDGYDWQQINNLSVSKQIKDALVKAAIESNVFCGKSVFTAKASLTDYANYLDIFYQKNEHLYIPIFFALKIADMSLSGVPDTQIKLYRQAVVNKLKNTGLIQSPPIR